MDNNSDKNSIKEMLEGHKKKFNVVAVVVGIAVVAVIALGAAYVIHTLNSSPKSYTEENLNKYMESTKEQTENVNAQPKNVNAVQNNAQNTSENGVNQSANNSKNGVEENAQNNQGGNQPKTYPVVTQTGNKTQTAGKINNNMNNTTQTVASQSGKNMQKNQQSVSGPQIINPYAKEKPSKIKNSAKSGINSKIETKNNSKTKHKRVLVAEKTTRKHKKYRHTAVKKYVLQVSSNLDKKFVSVTLEKLKRCGYKAYIRIKIINNKVYRRVMVGPIAGYTAAKDEALLIKRQLRLNYMPIIKKYDKIP